MVEQYPARSLPSGSPLVKCAGRKGGGRWHHAEHGKPAKVAASNLTCGRSRTHKGMIQAVCPQLEDHGSFAAAALLAPLHHRRREPGSVHCSGCWSLSPNFRYAPFPLHEPATTLCQEECVVDARRCWKVTACPKAVDSSVCVCVMCRVRRESGDSEHLECVGPV